MKLVKNPIGGWPELWPTLGKIFTVANSKDIKSIERQLFNVYESLVIANQGSEGIKFHMDFLTNCSCQKLTDEGYKESIEELTRRINDFVPPFTVFGRKLAEQQTVRPEIVYGVWANEAAAENLPNSESEEWAAIDYYFYLKKDSNLNSTLWAKLSSGERYIIWSKVDEH